MNREVLFYGMIIAPQKVPNQLTIA